MPTTSHHWRYLFLLSLVLAAKAALMFGIIQQAGIGLGPDEAQYWTWSQQPDWGYYSKPPGIAWQIGLGTFFVGNTEFGVRLPAIILGILIPFCIYALAQHCKLRPATCFWAALAMALSPMGILASLLAITDGGMWLFWTLGCIILAKAIRDNAPPNYLLLGLVILCGALFKWPTYSFWLMTAACCVIWPQIASRKLFLGIGLSLLALLPSLYWNAQHDWVTFRHVLATLGGGHAKTGAQGLAGNPLDFIGAQAALVSPILFVLLLMAWISLIRRRRDIPAPLLFCGGSSLAILLCALLLSFFIKLQGNWAVFAYPTAFVFLAWYVCEAWPRLKAWLIGGLGLSVLLCLALFSLPSIQSNDLFSKLPISYRLNPFRHNVGWENLEIALKKAGYHPEQDFIFGDKYQTASILSFYGPEQRRAYFFNLHSIRKNQFSFWPGPEKGRRGFFVVTENAPHLERTLTQMLDSYQRQLQPYFEQVVYKGDYPLFEAYGKVVKAALIFECVGYKGYMPKDPELY